MQSVYYKSIELRKKKNVKVSLLRLNKIYQILFKIN